MLTRSGVGGLVSGPALGTLIPGDEAPPAALEDRLRPLLVECVQRFGESAALTVDTPTGARYLTNVLGPSAIQAPDPTGERLDFHLVAGPGADDVMGQRTPRHLHRRSPAGRHTTHHHGRRNPPRRRPYERRARLRLGRPGARPRGQRRCGAGTRADPVASISLYGPAYRLNPSDRPDLGDARDLVSEQAPGLLGV